MEIRFKETLRSLRRQKGITQEALANHLGITPQSVGKWERGEGFPDITLLPKIAFYFDITVDELLGVDQSRVENAICEYQKQSKICQQNGETEKDLEIWEQAYAEFPNDCRVIEGLMFALSFGMEFPCPMDKAKRIIALGEALLERSKDSAQRENAIQCLCCTYNGIDKEKALRYADMGGSLHVTREALRSMALEGEEGVQACQSHIMSLIHGASMTASLMTAKKRFSPEAAIEAHRFAIDILKRLYSDGNVGFYAFDISCYYRNIALQYAEMNDAQNTLKALAESCGYAVMEAQLKDMDYTAPMVNRLKYKKSATCKNYKGNACNVRMEDLNDRRFDFVRKEDAFKNMAASLEKYAE